MRAGDLVVGIVRRPDPVPCSYCAAGEWDMCRNGQYTEQGIRSVTATVRTEFAWKPAFAVKVDATLVEFGVLRAGQCRRIRRGTTPNESCDARQRGARARC